mmetsp:Transcript_6648/g.16197  ORF Transcript_6648/g.16197 Transcript_6648/m.16197 type:complete len:796 (+) Transcript_6648:92-2479(+)
MVSPKTLSKSVISSDAASQKMNDNTPRSPRPDPPSSPRSVGDEERNPSPTAASIASITGSTRSSSRSMAAVAEAHKSEHEHWDEVTEREASIGGGCQGCSTGTETVTAFGDVVTEVFDLINEVAFPDVLDLAKEEEEDEQEKKTGDDDSTYEEDEDSIFNRTDEYSNVKHAKEFLGFIGAVKTDSAPIISTPLAPPSLLVPGGMPLNLPMDRSLLVEILSKEEFSFEPESKDEIIAAPESKEEEGSCDKDGKEQICGEKDDESSTKSTSERSVRSSSPDRCSSIERNAIGEGTSSDDDSDWVEKKTEGKYTTYIENAKTKKESNTTTSAAAPQGKFVMPFAAIAHKLKYGFKRASKTPSVGGEDQSELLTIVESSDEDAHISEEEDATSEHEGVQFPNKYHHASDAEKLDDNIKDTFAEENIEHQVKIESERKPTKETDEDDFCSNERSYSEDGDDRTYVSYAMSEDDSFFDMDNNSVTYSIGSKDSFLEDSLLDDSITHHSNSYEDETSDESASRHSESTGSSAYDESATEEHLASIATERRTDDEGEKERKSKKAEVSQHGSVYDNLYPTDSLFSFPTKDESNESLFDFSDNSNLEQENKEKKLSDESLQPPTSVILDKNSIIESEDEEETSTEEREQFQEDRGEDEVVVQEKDAAVERKQESEERDGTETEQNKKKGSAAEEKRRDDERVSQSVSSLVATEDIEAKELLETPVADDPKTNSTERKDETRNSNRSNSTYESTRAAEQGDKTGLKTTSPGDQDRAPARYRRQLSRVKMYNQHRQNMRKLQQKAE